MEVEMVLEDLLIAADPDSKRAELLLDSFFKRSEDGTWSPGCFAPAVSAESFEIVTSPVERKALINDLLNSSCEIPNRERAAFQALL